MSEDQPAFIIEFVPIPGLTFALDKYYLTEFQDNITTKYSETPVYGRMDPIVNFQGSTRKITVGFEVTKTLIGEEMATLHLNIGNLKKMQYPVYENEFSALTIQRPPLVKVSFSNLIRDPLTGGPLICAMGGASFTPKTGFTPLDSPFVVFGRNPPTTAGTGKRTKPGTGVGIGGKQGEFEFNTYNFRFDFTPLHQGTMGHKEEASAPLMYEFLGGAYLDL